MHDRETLQRINTAILQFIQDGVQGRSRAADDVARLTGVSLTASAMVVIDRLSGRAMRVNDLGAAVGVTSGAITRQVQDLEAKGLIDRSRDELDGRAAIVRLSERGREVARLSDAVRELHLRHILDGWPVEEVERIAPLLEHLAEGLRTTPNGESVLARALDLPSVSAEECIRRLEEGATPGGS